MMIEEASLQQQSYLYKQTRL